MFREQGMNDMQKVAASLPVPQTPYHRPSAMINLGVEAISNFDDVLVSSD